MVYTAVPVFHFPLVGNLQLVLFSEKRGVYLFVITHCSQHLVPAQLVVQGALPCSV